MRERGLRVGICTAGRSDVAHGDVDDMGRNPLGWTLASLAAQSATIDHVHILKHGDCAEGFEDVVARFQATLPISVEYWPRTTPVGVLRNRLVELAGDDLLYFLDDDAILSTEAALGRQVARFSRAGERAAVLQAPVLRRSIHPRALTPGTKVASVDARAGEVTFAFDAAALCAHDELAEVPLLDIDHLCLAQCLVDPVHVRAVGGFTNFAWPAVYGQESELGVRLVDAGFGVTFLPDAATSVIHLKFGAPAWTGSPSDGKTLPGRIRFSVASALAEAGAANGEDSWSRKSSAGFFTDFVSGFGAVFARRGPDGVHRFLRNVARRFVVENRLHHPFVLPIESRDERLAAFRDGVKRLQDAEIGGELPVSELVPASGSDEEIAWI
ncbi:MAG: glycosyltransferase [Actinomycetota bacterium]